MQDIVEDVELEEAERPALGIGETGDVVEAGHDREQHGVDRREYPERVHGAGVTFRSSDST